MGLDIGTMSIVSLLRVVCAVLVLDRTRAQTCDSTLSGWPHTNRPAYCCPYAGDGTSTTNTTRKCRKIDPYNPNAAPTPPYYISDIPTTTTPNPCYWTNLAGQTPDTQTVWNSPFKNFFVTIGSYSKPSSTNSDHQLPSGSNYAPAYYAQVRDPDGSTSNGDTQNTYKYGVAECLVAQEYYNSFLSALNRYNCEEQYSHWNCYDCRKAYARWAAAMALPACALTSSDTAGGASCTAIKPCVRVCNEVVQKCPVTLGFTCPGDNRDYSDADYCETLNALETESPKTPLDSSTNEYYSASTTTSTVSFTTSCCNPMGLQNNAPGLSPGHVLMAVCASVLG